MKTDYTCIVLLTILEEKQPMQQAPSDCVNLLYDYSITLTILAEMLEVEKKVALFITTL